MGRIGIRQGCGFDSRRLHQLTQVTSMTWVLRSRRRHYLSTVYAVSVSIEESDCVFQRRWTQVHIHLGRHQRPPEGMGALDDGCSDRKVQNVCADSSVETPRHSGDFSRFSLSLTPQSMAKKFGTIRLLAMEVSRRRCESSEILLAPFGVSARPTSS